MAWWILGVVEEAASLLVGREIFGLSNLLNPLEGDSADSRCGASVSREELIEATDPVDDLRRPANETTSLGFLSTELAEEAGVASASASVALACVAVVG